MTEFSLAPQQVAKLAAMRDKFAADVPRRLAALRAAWASVLSAAPQPVAQAVWHDCHRLAHTMVGSAGTFGFLPLSQRARALEQLFLPWVGASPPAQLTEADRAEINAALEALHAPELLAPELLQAPERSAAPDSDVTVAGGLSTDMNTGTGLHKHTSPAEQAAQPELAMRNRVLFWVEDDLMVAADAVSQLSVFGWKVRAFLDATEALAAVEGEGRGPGGEKLEAPAAIAIDVNLPEGPLAGLELAAKIKAGPLGHLPVAIVSSRWDWETRLAAVRARADAYWVKPVDYARLDEQLEALTLPAHQAPERVLVVDDDALLAARYAEVLRQAGMQVTTLSDPTALLDVLAAQTPERLPELVLMDLVMPGCSGTEAASVVRQDPQFAGMPILFLSSESDPQARQAALRSGGDAFLDKAIHDDALVNAVRVRTARFRTLRSLIHQDPLTLALNVRAFARTFSAVLEHAAGGAEPLSVVRLDVDYFKRIDARYGQMVADQVLSALARMLRHRLRASDVLGRVWGDQFALLLPNTTAEVAEGYANTLREQFEQLRHHVGQSWFNCTFSAAVVSLPYQANSDAWNLAADAALAQAKTAGRNCVRRYIPAA